MQWRYCSLALSHWYALYIETCLWLSIQCLCPSTDDLYTSHTASPSANSEHAQKSPSRIWPPCPQRVFRRSRGPWVSTSPACWQRYWLDTRSREASVQRGAGKTRPPQSENEKQTNVICSEKCRKDMASAILQANKCHLFTKVEERQGLHNLKVQKRKISFVLKVQSRQMSLVPWSEGETRSPQSESKKEDLVI